jgi:hypothetical protein
MLIFPIVFIIGFLNRIADMVSDDGLKLNRPLAYFAGILYGFLIAYVITAYPVLAELGMAIILSVILTGKIDHPVHYLGLGSMLFFLVIYGISPINITLLIVFIVGAGIDEFGNGLADRKRIKGILGTFFHYRLTMEVLTFMVSIVTGFWIFFLAMISYDAGFSYAFPERVKRKLISICG